MKAIWKYFIVYQARSKKKGWMESMVTCNTELMCENKVRGIEDVQGMEKYLMDRSLDTDTTLTDLVIISYSRFP